MGSIFTSHFKYSYDEQDNPLPIIITTHCTRYDMLDNLVELYRRHKEYSDIYVGEGVVVATREPITFNEEDNL